MELQERERLTSVIESNMGLVVSLLKKHFVAFDKSTHDDLLQCGRIGIWKAALKFDPTREVKFSTVATNYAMWEIIRFIQKENKWLKRKSKSGVTSCVGHQEPEVHDNYTFLLPDNLSELERNVISCKHEGYKNEEIADKLGINKHTFKKIYQRAKRKILEGNETQGLND